MVGSGLRQRPPHFEPRFTDPSTPGTTQGVTVHCRRGSWADRGVGPSGGWPGVVPVRGSTCRAQPASWWPPAGTLAQRCRSAASNASDSTFSVKFSTGPAKVTIPSGLVGLTTGQAERLLKKAGFTNVATRPAVIDTDVAAGRHRSRTR